MWVYLLNDEFNTASEAWNELAMNCKDIESRGTEKKAAKNGVLVNQHYIRKGLKLKDVTYTILNEKDSAMNEKLNHVLAYSQDNTEQNYEP